MQIANEIIFLKKKFFSTKIHKFKFLKNLLKFTKINNLLHTGKKREFPGKNDHFPVFPRFPGNRKVREIANPRTQL